MFLRLMFNNTASCWSHNTRTWFIQTLHKTISLTFYIAADGPMPMDWWVVLSSLYVCCIWCTAERGVVVIILNISLARKSHHITRCGGTFSPNTWKDLNTRPRAFATLRASQTLVFPTNTRYRPVLVLGPRQTMCGCWLSGPAVYSSFGWNEENTVVQNENFVFITFFNIANSTLLTMMFFVSPQHEVENKSVKQDFSF